MVLFSNSKELEEADRMQLIAGEIAKVGLDGMLTLSRSQRSKWFFCFYFQPRKSAADRSCKTNMREVVEITAT